MSLIDFLAQKKLIEEAALVQVKREAQSLPGGLDEAMEKRGVTEDALLNAKGEYYNIPVRQLDNIDVPFSILQYIPEESAIHYQFIPIAVENNFLEVGIVDPSNIEARDALNFISAKVDLPYKLFLISRSDFDRILSTYKGLSGQVTRALGELETDLTEEEKAIKNDQETETAVDTQKTTIIEDAPVTKIVATILRYAVEGDASDVHIEHMKDRVRVRFRVDGLLNTSLILPMKVHSAVIARIKILAAMKLDEKRKPQDGRFSARIEGRKVDFRVSTFPAYYGEKVVMRILDQDKGVKAITELGLSDRNLKLIQKGIEAPYGMVLISGPTGSGKTTTLYSILEQIDREQYNVLSLEDPVEYSIDGVSQSQVHTEIGYSFATGLRTTLRQDPDIIMVGEIRDGETAKLAIQAALTGHLVFSTIHTNSAAGIVPRLIDMGVDPYLIPPTLVLGIAQRLARTICPGTGKPMPIEGSIKEMMDKQFADLPAEHRHLVPDATEVLQAEATAECPTGTRGREAVFEVFEMNREIEDVILKNPTETAIYEAARKQGMLTIREDAMVKAMQKKIPFEEVYKL